MSLKKAFEEGKKVGREETLQKVNERIDEFKFEELLYNNKESLMVISDKIRKELKLAIKGDGK